MQGIAPLPPNLEGRQLKCTEPGGETLATVNRPKTPAPQNTSKDSQLTFRLPEALRAKLERIAEAQDRSVGYVLCQLIEAAGEEPRPGRKGR